MNNFNSAFEDIILIEKGYVDDPLDPGKKTRYGITEKTARQFGYKGNMTNLPKNTARVIYKELFWDKLKLDTISETSFDVAHKLFDIGVNAGVMRAGIFFQTILNTMRRAYLKDPIFEKLIVDGLIGPVTLEAFEKIQSDSQIIYTLLNCQQGAYYINISNQNINLQKFIRGWVDKRISII